MTSIVIQVIISAGQFISMGVALWPVAGRAPACVAQRHYWTDAHAIRSAKLARCAPSLFYPPTATLGSHGREGRGSGKAPRRSARAEQHQDDDAAGPTDSTAPSTRQGLRVVPAWPMSYLCRLALRMSRMTDPSIVHATCC